MNRMRAIRIRSVGCGAVALMTLWGQAAAGQAPVNRGAAREAGSVAAGYDAERQLSESQQVVDAIRVSSPISLTEPGMFVNASGQVGIGLSAPTRDLHIVGGNGLTAMRIQETNATVVTRGILEIVNTGPASIAGTNSVTGQTYLMTFGDFWQLFSSGAGGPLLTIFNTGQVLLGNPGAFNLIGGNLTIGGTLTQGSSRSVKHDFERTDSQEILSRVGLLDLSKWSYKSEDTRHFGPMAEDFHALFGLGASAQGLAPGDVAGVALAAIQGLQKELNTTRSELDRSRTETADLESRLVRLEQMLNAGVQ